MVHSLLIGFAAGIAAALLFASVATGSALTVLLFYAAPLPILLAGLGWRHWAGLIATLVAAVVLGIVFDLRFVFAFVVGVGMPAWTPAASNGIRSSGSCSGRRSSAQPAW